MRSNLAMGILVALGTAASVLGGQVQAAQPGTSVVAAVSAHDVAGLRALLKKGADVNASDVDGTTPLMVAVRERDIEMISALLSAGADANAANRYGATALHTAAANGDAAAAKLLLDAGANPRTASPEGGSALMAAARTGNVELINALLAGGKPQADGSTSKADPNLRESWMGQTALMMAAGAGHDGAILALVAGGARVDDASTEIVVPPVNPDRRIGGFVYPVIPKGRMTALHFAARGGHLAAVRALIKSGANLNIGDADGSNALVLATLNGNPEVAVELLEAGADPKVADKYGRTVLFVATDMNTLDANPRPAPPIKGNKTYVDVVKAAVAKGADVNARLTASLPIWVAQGGTHNPVLRDGATAFLRASMSADLEVMNLLLGAGADTSLATNDDPRSAGRIINENSGKTTPLMAAAGVGWREEVSRGRVADAIEAVKLLLAKGGKINDANQGGDTPLHGAAYRGSPELVEFLLKQGANPTLKNGRGFTALDIATGQPDYRILPNAAVANALRQHGTAKLSSSR